MKRKELLEKAVQTVMSKPGVIVRIWSSSRHQCKKLFHSMRKQVVAETNTTDLRIIFWNRSEIRFADGSQAHMYRGESTVLEVVLLPEWVANVAAPCLFDTGGELLVEDY